jgi:hypothetical protein
MRKRITLLVAAFMLALTMSFGSVAAFADSPRCEAQEKNNWECQGSKLFNKGGQQKGKFTGSG